MRLLGVKLAPFCLKENLFLARSKTVCWRGSNETCRSQSRFVKQSRRTFLPSTELSRNG
jgi:hypothetical protein